MSRIVLESQQGAVEEAAGVLGSGGLAVIPTDTVYGVAARLDRPDALEAIFEVKKRDRSKPLAVLVPSPGSARDLAVFGSRAEQMSREGWPGALTLVLEAAARLPPQVSAVVDGLPTVALRMPDHPFALALLELCGPLAATSANLSGEGVAGTIEDAMAALGGGVELFVDAGPIRGRPSRVVSVVGETQVLRQG